MITEAQAPVGVVVRIGSTVTLLDEGRKMTWTIVPNGEGDAIHGHASEGTPLAQAVLNHGVGQRVEVRLPGGRGRPVTILNIA